MQHPTSQCTRRIRQERAFVSLSIECKLELEKKTEQATGGQICTRSTESKHPRAAPGFSYATCQEVPRVSQYPSISHFPDLPVRQRVASQGLSALQNARRPRYPSPLKETQRKIKIGCTPFRVCYSFELCKGPSRSATTGVGIAIIRV